MQYDQAYFLPTVQVQRYRYLRVNDAGRVSLQFYNLQGQPSINSASPAARSSWSWIASRS